MAAVADGSLTITPSRGVPGAHYQVAVSCGEQPLVARRNLQDDYVQATIAPTPVDHEVAPSTWVLDQTATRFDAEYTATCKGVFAGSDRFDVKAPHLWFGPRPRYPFDTQPRTQVEGTDCPDGTTATVSITTGGKTSTSKATIDHYGDWSAVLPVPVGQAEISVDASCGAVAYPTLRATTTTTTSPATTATTGAPAASDTGPAVRAAVPAVPQPGRSAFTG